jgi:hypothetical protein
VEARRNEEKEGKEEEGSGAADRAVALTVVLFFLRFPCPLLLPSLMFFLFFPVLLMLFFSLSTMFSPLCSGFVAMLLFSMVHSGGFTVADDSSWWFFPCSLLIFP